MSLANYFALVVGVGNYLNPGFSNLPVTVKDAEAIASLLKSPICGYPADHVTVLTGELATRQNILDSIQALAWKTDAHSVVFIYFSGHGGRLQQGSAWNTYLCPRDSDLKDIEGSAISGELFSAALAGLKASKLVVVLDSCHAGGAVDIKSAEGGASWKNGLPEEYYEMLSRGSGRVVIASSRSDQLSYYDLARHPLSLFTHHLIQAIAGRAAVRNDGYVHILDVFHSVNEDVQRDEPRQTPMLRVKDLDMNFPIALANGGKAPAAAAGSSPVAALRETIIADPLKGSERLSRYLAQTPDWLSKRDEVDLKRAELERIQHDLDLFGSNDNDHAAKNRIVYFLLRTCLWLEQQK